jgi:hypothetical protein
MAPLIVCAGCREKKRHLHSPKTIPLQVCQGQKLLAQNFGVYKMQLDVYQPNRSPHVHMDFVIHIRDAILEN